MKRYFIYLAYNGANYCGWQIQPNGVSVQETIEKALTILLKTPIAIVGAGRTDAGVHAKSMVAHFDSNSESVNLDELTEKLDRFLPKDISIHKIVEVNAGAHARFDAGARLYRYYITTTKDPFLHQLKYKVTYPLDVEKMNTCAAALFDYKDFTSFSKVHTDVKTNNCDIMHAEWSKDGTEYVFTIKANRFLRNMVRSIVGTLIDAGRGKIGEAEFRAIIQAKNRGKAGTSAPGNALFLEDIEYDERLFEI